MPDTDGTATESTDGNQQSSDQTTSQQQDSDATSADDTTNPTETVEFWKSQARKQEQRAKANAEKAQAFDKLEDANKTELQRANDAAAKAQADAKAAELRAARAEVATAKGLTASQAKRLVGETREDLEADADELLKDLKPDAKKTDLKQGARGGNPSEDPDAWLRRLSGRR